jgi:hypothetical protein
MLLCAGTGNSAPAYLRRLVTSHSILRAAAQRDGCRLAKQMCWTWLLNPRARVGVSEAPRWLTQTVTVRHSRTTAVRAQHRRREVRCKR